MKHLLLAAGAVLGLALTPSHTLADTTWTSTSQNLWANPADWGSGLPNGSSAAIFADPGTPGLVHTIDVSVQNTIARGLIFSASSAGNGFTIMSSQVPAIMQMNAAPSGNTIANNDTRAQTISVPLKLFSANGFAGSSAAQTWSAAAGNLLFTGAYKVSGATATVDNNGGRLSIDGSYNTTIGASNGRGDIIGVGGLTKNGSGSLFLGGTNANTFSGGTLLNGGSIIANKVNVLGSGSLTMGLGTIFNTGGFNQSLGTLSLTGTGGPAGSGAGIDFGLNGNTLSFANSSAMSWTGNLTIYDWNPNTDKLRFGTDANGLTATQLSEITFDGFGGAKIDSSGFITVVPEPSALAFGLLALFSWRLGHSSRRR
jgi:fibronectin-binding autotransporter adhesin